MARILIVEDDPACLELAVRIVRLEHHESTTALDGETALALARKIHPDAILLDLHIPKVDGWTVVKQLRREKWAAHVPVIAVSASATLPEQEHALRAGCDEFLPKPFYPEQLRAMLDKHLKHTPVTP
ncbi:MAG TPA: response regulator [Candidatus Limnocylindria bacterium]